MSLNTPRASVPVPPPLAFIAGIIAGFLLHLVAPVYLVDSEETARALGWVGAGLMAISVGLVIATVVAFRKARTTPFFDEASTSLIVQGPFRVSRNPLYLAAALLHLGLSLRANAFWPLLLLVPAFFVVNRLIRREEGYLAQRFGSEYEAYCRRVRRWL
jgi:protein-S-isoprenylcysteine O-methyltransferase Ste14